MPASILALMVRQELYTADVPMMHLSEIERIDEIEAARKGTRDG